MSASNGAVWTEADLAAAMDLMRACNEYEPPARPDVRPPVAMGPGPVLPAPARDGDRVGDAFNRAADWRDILEPKGWRVHHATDSVLFWTRPDKDTRKGLSATTGFCKGEQTGERLYVFTTNAAPLESNTSYSKLAAYAILHHGGDFRAAVRELAKRYAPEPPRVGPGVPTELAPPPDVPAEPTAADADDVAGIIDLKRAGAAVRWVWPGWIQRGVVTAIAAQGGTGKTRLSADLVRRVTHGLAWPDGQPTGGWDGRAVALWVVADNHHDEMVTLSESFGIVASVRVNAGRSDPYAGVTLELLEDFAALERRVRAVRPLFVFIDTVGNATDKNMSRQEDAKAFYQPLQLIARRCDVAVVALTHLNAQGKALGRRVMEKVRTCIRLSTNDPNDPHAKRRLEIVKSNSKLPKPLGLSMHDDRNDYDNDPPPPPEEAAAMEAGPSAAVKECADWLKDKLKAGPASVYTLRNEAEGDGMSSKTLYSAKPIAGVVEFELADATGKQRKYWKLKE